MNVSKIMATTGDSIKAARLATSSLLLTDLKSRRHIVCTNQWTWANEEEGRVQIRYAHQSDIIGGGKEAIPGGLKVRLERRQRSPSVFRISFFPSNKLDRG
ncbi:hypothetical protein TNCV_2987671 [Trichonephila clavipes]|nr:hypothetical protein TNCV_2987671 [Trichonephila clavipes]